MYNYENKNINIKIKKICKYDWQTDLYEYN